MRLTNVHKRKIRQGMLHKRFDEEAVALLKEERELALNIHRRLYLPEVVKELARAADGKFPEVDYIGAQIGGGYTQLYFNRQGIRIGEDFIALEDEIKVRVYYKHKGTAAIVIDALDHLARAYRAFEDKTKTFRDGVKEAKAQIDAALSGINTDKVLAEAWPEAIEFLPADAAKVYLPALPREDLNKMLGLETKQ